VSLVYDIVIGPNHAAIETLRMLPIYEVNFRCSQAYAQLGQRVGVRGGGAAAL